MPPSILTDAPELTPRRDIFTVSRLNREVRELLEGSFPLVWVEGEVSNFARPSSGHWYFSLKDASAQVRCAMFRNRNYLLGFTPENGAQVLVRARLSLYEPRGDYQLIVEHMEEAGDGALRRAFEELKQRLAAEGLFDETHKRPLPALPRRIGVITSPTGAAIRDILSVLQRRFPAIPVLIYPVPVQGREAAPAIARMIRLACRRRDCDVLILARGGGSLEDLWAFNEECVARAIHECDIPIVSGVGHEIDFTIADFAADLRAPTPSGAAELASPDGEEWRRRLRHGRARLKTVLRRRLADDRQRLRWLAARLRQQHPGQRLQQWNQRLDELEQRMLRAMDLRLERNRSRLRELRAHLRRHDPRARLRQARERCRRLAPRLRQVMRRRLQERRHRLEALGRALNAVSPLATLGRGYAILRTLPEGELVRDARQVRAGDAVEARLARGRLICDVRDVKND
ncbi:MAG TPA: exodeoxyribonuclease VII large subunit [Gammaproteobacteria bacterium]|nr:exodeoxyribonuclease VII large subunit [Gammaproteobacteria bacterium]